MVAAVRSPSPRPRGVLRLDLVNPALDRAAVRGAQTLDAAGVVHALDQSLDRGPLLFEPEALDLLGDKRLDTRVETFGALRSAG